ncbi:MAG: acyl-CoA dehydrogenase-like [Bacteroidota bacterium]|nr:acyl-CoA dehydrogenase-like [Bacteroidota bacterium]
MILLHPAKTDFSHLDGESQKIMRDTVAFFEKKGKEKLMEDDRNYTWYDDFLTFIKEEKIFARLMTPAGYGPKDSRWDTSRIAAFTEILGFYGLCYWYSYQVSSLGLGPVWMSDNEKVKESAAKLLDAGHIFAFGLSEKEHGADIYSSDMIVTPTGEGKYSVTGKKYYIGNGNKAGIVSVFGKMAAGGYVFFAVDSQHPAYKLVKNVVNSQSYVSEFHLNDYPITDADILHLGDEAWNAALNTVNINKYNLGWGSIGICTHAFYEAINHAANRNLYGKFVTDFPHIKDLFIKAYTRLVAMKLFALRATDYMRTAKADDRRYLLYNPMVKMKVTTEGEHVINALWDVIAAKGFEKDMYFNMAARDIRALPKLEGTVHVNMALIIKFMPNYFFNPGEFAEIPSYNEPVNDSFLFNQGPTKGLSKIQFHDYDKAYSSVHLPNVNVFKTQIAIFKESLMMAGPDAGQQKDIDYLLKLGELFTLVVYGQLILENAAIYNIGDDMTDQIFEVLVGDFSRFALELYSKSSSSESQMDFAQRMIKKPVSDAARSERVWTNEVYALNGAYEMKK